MKVRCDGAGKKCKHKTCIHYKPHEHRTDKCAVRCTLTIGVWGASCSAVTSTQK